MLTLCSMTKAQTAIERAAQAVGGFPELARKLGVTRHAIYQWDRVPANRVIPIERATGVSRHELRPDLYPLTTPKGKAA